MSWRLRTLCSENTIKLSDVPRSVVVYNPLEQRRTTVVSVTVDTPDVTVLEAESKRPITAQISAVWEEPSRASAAASGCRVLSESRPNRVRLSIRNSHLEVFGSASSGLMQPCLLSPPFFLCTSLTCTPPSLPSSSQKLRLPSGQVRQVQVQFLWYGTRSDRRDKSGAYLFLLETKRQGEAPPTDSGPATDSGPPGLRSRPHTWLWHEGRSLQIHNTVDISQNPTENSSCDWSPTSPTATASTLTSTASSVFLRTLLVSASLSAYAPRVGVSLVRSSCQRLSAYAPRVGVSLRVRSSCRVLFTYAPCLPLRVRSSCLRLSSVRSSCRRLSAYAPRVCVSLAYAPRVCVSLSVRSRVGVSLSVRSSCRRLSPRTLLVSASFRVRPRVGVFPRTRSVSPRTLSRARLSRVRSSRLSQRTLLVSLSMRLCPRLSRSSCLRVRSSCRRLSPRTLLVSASLVRSSCLRLSQRPPRVGVSSYAPRVSSQRTLLSASLSAYAPRVSSLSAYAPRVGVSQRTLLVLRLSRVRSRVRRTSSVCAYSSCLRLSPRTLLVSASLSAYAPRLRLSRTSSGVSMRRSSCRRLSATLLSSLCVRSSCRVSRRSSVSRVLVSASLRTLLVSRLSACSSCQRLSLIVSARTLSCRRSYRMSRVSVVRVYVNPRGQSLQRRSQCLRLSQRTPSCRLNVSASTLCYANLVLRLFRITPPRRRVLLFPRTIHVSAFSMSTSLRVCSSTAVRSSCLRLLSASPFRYAPRVCVSLCVCLRVGLSPRTLLVLRLSNAYAPRLGVSLSRTLLVSESLSAYLSCLRLLRTLLVSASLSAYAPRVCSLRVRSSFGVGAMRSRRSSCRASLASAFSAYAPRAAYPSCQRLSPRTLLVRRSLRVRSSGRRLSPYARCVGRLSPAYAPPCRRLPPRNAPRVGVCSRNCSSADRALFTTYAPANVGDLPLRDVLNYALVIGVLNLSRSSCVGRSLSVHDSSCTASHFRVTAPRVCSLSAYAPRIGVLSQTYTHSIRDLPSLYRRTLPQRRPSPFPVRSSCPASLSHVRHLRMSASPPR
ncbi:hypothetical protein WMY93_032393 [Mugilogobius chulae]|uniref:Uncharacterized protein n=1 Tax=Mugilogobius chulae TaxID=88201 RepID=A0AAW0MNF6_9GOBI